MAQRKPKQSLIVEIPRPRLTDEELMEMFYRGERRNTAGVETDESLLDSHENDAVPLPKVSKGIESPNNKPIILEPLIEKPSKAKPFISEPYSREPIKEQSGSTTTLSINAATSLRDPQTSPTATSNISGQDYPSATSETDEHESIQSSREVQNLAIGSQSLETNSDTDDEKLVA